MTEGDVERLYRDQGRRLWAAIFAYAREQAIADDAVAEAFSQLLRRESEIRDPAAWVWAAAFKIAGGELERRGRYDHDVPEGIYVDRFADAEVLGAVAALPERQRAAVLLFYFADRPIKEAAAILGMSSSTFRVHLTRARRHLNRTLGGDR